jgi:N-acetylglucosamine malate deacetylase 1
MNKKVMFIAVHPDDETLGCAGTILKHKETGDKIYWLIITNIFEKDGWNQQRVVERKNEIDLVAKSYGFDETIKIDLPTTKLDSIPLGDLTKMISERIEKNQPDIIYIPNRTDVHSDHRIAYTAIISATKVFNKPYIKKILMYECVSETDFAPPLPENVFMPNYFVDISKYINEKIRIMKIYSGEIKEHPYPRSERNLRALATYRGAQCGTDYAESFMILKDIWK